MNAGAELQRVGQGRAGVGTRKMKNGLGESTVSGMVGLYTPSHAVFSNLRGSPVVLETYFSGHTASLNSLALL